MAKEENEPSVPVVPDNVGQILQRRLGNEPLMMPKTLTVIKEQIIKETKKAIREPRAKKVKRLARNKE